MIQRKYKTSLFNEIKEIKRGANFTGASAVPDISKLSLHVCLHTTHITDLIKVYIFSSCTKVQPSVENPTSEGKYFSMNPISGKF